MGDVLRAALPSAFLLESETVVGVASEEGLKNINLTDEQFLVFEALQQQSRLKVQEIQAIVNKKNILPILTPLLDAKVLTTTQNLIEK